MADNLLARVQAAIASAENYALAVREAVRQRVAAASLDAEQHAAHGYAWVETSIATLAAIGQCARRRPASRPDWLWGNACPVDRRTTDGPE
jgi:hypothetical protein